MTLDDKIYPWTAQEPEYQDRPVIKGHKVPHEVSFNGKHNTTKAKILLLLYARRYTHNDISGMTRKQLWQLTGVSYDYLRCVLPKWCRWKYLNADPGKTKEGKFCAYFTISERGEHFIEDRLPADVRERLITEIKDWQLTNRDSKTS